MLSSVLLPAIPRGAVGSGGGVAPIGMSLNFGSGATTREGSDMRVSGAMNHSGSVKKHHAQSSTSVCSDANNR